MMLEELINEKGGRGGKERERPKFSYNYLHVFVLIFKCLVDRFLTVEF